VNDIIPQLIANSLITGSIYALASLGLSMSYGLLRVLNFAHGHMMMLGAYLFLFFSQDQALSLPLASIATFFAIVVFSILILNVFIQPFLRYSFLLTFVSTMALSIILESIVSMVFGVHVRVLSGIAIESAEYFGAYVTNIQIAIIAIAFSIFIVTGIVIHHLPVGRRIRALSENRHAAEAMGISFRRVSYLVFCSAIVTAAIAGVLVGYETNLQPTMGITYTIKAFAVMIFGGLGNVWGTLVASYLLGIIENFSIGLFEMPAGYRDAIAFVLILVMLLVRPQGIFGKRQRKI
jgi:branched-chain amino acid transport system permease protein